MSTGATGASPSQIWRRSCMESEGVAAVACSAVLDRAFGKPQPRPLEKDDEEIARIQRMTPDERMADAKRLIE